jgi:predicted ArsR family transcriptional regulator
MSKFNAALYPDRAGFKEHETSLDAARKINVEHLRGEVLFTLMARPQTADEVAGNIGRDVLAVRPRLSELRKQGKIEPTGERRKNESGMSAHVWMVKR